MTIIYKPDETGEKIPYEVKKGKITFDDELMLNLAKYERDDANHIDVCRDRFGNLVTGVIPGVAEFYVAQIDIPPRAYTEILGTTVNEEGEEIATVTLEPVPFDADKCTLTLWTLV